MPLSLAVLVSGGGSNLQSIIDKIESGVLDAEIRLVVSNKASAHGLERARSHGIPTAVFALRDYENREACDAAMVEAIRDAGADFVCLAGFMRMITPVLLDAFPGRVINIHPSLLPSFPGLDGQGDASAYGVKLAGCTVHFVDEGMDSGPIIMQAAVPVLPGEERDSLAARILTMEHRILPQVLQWFAMGRIRREGRSVHVDGGPGGSGLAAQCGAYIASPPLERGF